MMGTRRPRKMKNRGMFSGPRKKLRLWTSADKISRLNEAINQIKEADKTKE